MYTPGTLDSAEALGSFGTEEALGIAVANDSVDTAKMLETQETRDSLG